MQVSYAASGVMLAAFDADEFQGKTVQDLKRALAAQTGLTRFRQRLLLDNGLSEIGDDEVLTAPVNIQLVVLDFFLADVREDRQMVLAAKTNDLVLLEQMLQRPRNPNGVDDHGNTPLHLAADTGHIEAVRLLLEAGARTDVRNHQSGGEAPLHRAAVKGNSEVIRILLEEGADKDIPTNAGVTPLFWAAMYGHLEVVRLLLDVGANKDVQTKAGTTPLLIATRHNYPEVARLLREARCRGSHHDG